MQWFWTRSSSKKMELSSFSKIQTEKTNRSELIQERLSHMLYMGHVHGPTRSMTQPDKADCSAPKEFYYVTVKTNRQNRTTNPSLPTTSVNVDGDVEQNSTVFFNRILLCLLYVMLGYGLVRIFFEQLPA